MPSMTRSWTLHRPRYLTSFGGTIDCLMAKISATDLWTSVVEVVEEGATSWDNPDWSLLDDRRGQLPEFPADLLDPSTRVVRLAISGITLSHRDNVGLDGSALETWLEHHPAVGAWHARNTLKVRPIDGIRSTDEFWEDFAGRFGPPITEEVLLCERKDAAEQVIQALLQASNTVSYR